MKSCHRHPTIQQQQQQQQQHHQQYQSSSISSTCFSLALLHHVMGLLSLKLRAEWQLAPSAYQAFPSRCFPKSSWHVGLLRVGPHQVEGWGPTKLRVGAPPSWGLCQELVCCQDVGHVFFKIILPQLKIFLTLHERCWSPPYATPKFDKMT